MASSKSMAAGACTLNEVFAPLPRPERGRPCSGAFKSSGGVLAYHRVRGLRVKHGTYADGMLVEERLGVASAIVQDLEGIW